MTEPVITMDIRGLDKQIRKLEGYPKSAKRHFGHAMGLSVVKVTGMWKKRAPVDRGTYRSSIAGTVKKSPVGTGLTGVVATAVTSPKGYLYPGALEYSERFHYRRGPRKGQRTAGHARTALKASKKAIQGYFDAAVKRILKDLVVSGN